MAVWAVSWAIWASTKSAAALSLSSRRASSCTKASWASAFLLAAAAAAASASAFLSEAEGVAKATAGEKRMAVPKMAALPPTNARLLSKV